MTRPKRSTNDRGRQSAGRDDRSSSGIDHRYPAIPAITLIVVAALVGSGQAHAEPHRPHGNGEVSANLRLAREAEERGEPLRAMELYQEVVEASPSSRLASRASDRLRWLSERSEGQYRPLAELLQFRNDPESRTPDRLVAFSARLENFPEGRVRREARALVANAWLEIGDRPAEALAMFESWAAEPGIEKAERILAIGGAARAKAQKGDVAGGLEMLREAGLFEEPELRRMRWAAVERIVLPLSRLLVVGFLLLAALALARARGQWRQWLRELNIGWLAIAVWVVAVPPAMAVAKDFTLVPLVPTIAAYSAALLGMAWLTGAALASSGAPTWQRRTAAAAAFAAVVSAGVLAVSRSDLPDHLQLWWGI